MEAPPLKSDRFSLNLHISHVWCSNRFRKYLINANRKHGKISLSELSLSSSVSMIFFFFFNVFPSVCVSRLFTVTYRVRHLKTEPSRPVTQTWLPTWKAARIIRSLAMRTWKLLFDPGRQAERISTSISPVPSWQSGGSPGRSWWNP